MGFKHSGTTDDTTPTSPPPKGEPPGPPEASTPAKPADPVARPTDTRRSPPDSGDSDDGPQVRPIPSTVAGRRLELDEAKGLGPAPFVSGDNGVEFKRAGGGPPVLSPVEYRPGRDPSVVDPISGERKPVEMGEDGRYRLKLPEAERDARRDGDRERRAEQDKERRADTDRERRAEPTGDSPAFKTSEYKGDAPSSPGKDTQSNLPSEKKEPADVVPPAVEPKISQPSDPPPVRGGGDPTTRDIASTPKDAPSIQTGEGAGKPQEAPGSSPGTRSAESSTEGPAGKKSDIAESARSSEGQASKGIDRPEATTKIAEAEKAAAEGKSKEQQAVTKDTSETALPPGMLGDKGGSDLATGIRVGDRSSGVIIKLGDLGISGRTLILGDGKDGIPLDLSTRKSREYIFDLLTRLHNGKLDGLDARGQKIVDALRSLDQDKLDGLRQLIGREFVEGIKPGRGTKFVDDLIGKIKELIDKGREGAVGDKGTKEIPPSDKGGRSIDTLTSAQRIAAEKLVDFIRANSESFKGYDVRAGSSAVLIELGRILRDLKDEPGKENIAFKDLISGTMKLGDKSGDSQGFRLPPSQESIVRAIVDKFVEARTEVAAQRGELRQPGDARLPEQSRKSFEDPARGSVSVAGRSDVTIPSAIDMSTRKADDAVSIMQTMGQLEGATLPSVDEEEDEARRRKAKVEQEQRDARDKEEAEAGQAAEAALAAQKLREQDEMRERERLEREEREWQERLEREAKERRDREEREKQKKNQRKKYKVRKQDTLESIAAKQLGNESLARLIYDINRASIPIINQAGKRLLNLQPGIILWLPSPLDIEDFGSTPFSGMGGRFEYLGAFATPEEELAAAFGGSASDYKNESEYAEDAVKLVAAQPNRSRIERVLGPVSSEPNAGDRIKYIVRLGDTLKSIAIKHPVLGDVALWKLLAEANGLATETDEKGVPLSVLKRGMTILIPTVNEIDAFRAKPKDDVRPINSELPTKPCPVCRRVTYLKAMLCPGCGHDFREQAHSDVEPPPPKAGEEHYAPTTFGPAFYDDMDVTSVILQAAGMISPSENDDVEVPPVDEMPVPIAQLEKQLELTAAAQVQPGAERAAIQQLGDSTRLVKISGGSGTLDAGFRLRLEIRWQAEWLPVVLYEIYDDVSLRHEYLLDGKRQTKRIDLPPQSVQELAENDLTANWQNYARNFQAGRSISE